MIVSDYLKENEHIIKKLRKLPVLSMLSEEELNKKDS